MFIKKSEEQPVRATAHNVRRPLIYVTAAFALLLSSSLVVGTALATPGSGVTSRTVATGQLASPVRMKLKESHGHTPVTPAGPVALQSNLAALLTMDSMEPGEGFGDGIDVSTISVVTNTIQPGGYFGWHQHGGPSWIVVTRGTLTFYDADDPTCTGHPVPAGSAYLDMGNHTHNARNETNQIVENYVVRMLPAGAEVRIDKPAPEGCPF